MPLAYAAAVTANRGARRLGGAAVVAVLVVAVLAATGSPGRLRLGDPALWLAAVVVLVAVPVLAWAALVLLRRHDSPKPHRERTPFDRSGLGVALLIVLAVAGLAWAFIAAVGGSTNRTLPRVAVKPLQPLVSHSAAPAGPYRSPDLLPWLGVLVGLGVLALLVFVVVNRLRNAPDEVEEPELAILGDPLVTAIEAALVDLEGEQDPRRAVIKAYARMEAVLRARGLPRDPAEAPLEYLDRVLRELGGQAAAIDRLTTLFEQAAFSRHDVGPAMRDEAVAAFHALRAGLTTSTGGA